MVAVVCCELVLNYLRERNLSHFKSGFLTAAAVNCAESEKSIAKVSALSLPLASVCPEDNSRERMDPRISNTLLLFNLFAVNPTIAVTISQIAFHIRFSKGWDRSKFKCPNSPNQ